MLVLLVFWFRSLTANRVVCSILVVLSEYVIVPSFLIWSYYLHQVNYLDISWILFYVFITQADLFVDIHILAIRLIHIHICILNKIISKKKKNILISCIYVCSTAPSWSTIMMTAKQFEKTGSVINLQTRKRNTSHKRKNAKIPSKKSMSEKPSLSIRKASRIAKIS